LRIASGGGPPDAAEPENPVRDAFLIAVQTLTRVPVPSPRSVDPGSVGWSSVFYPLVGAAMAAAGLLLFRVLSPVLPQSIVALVMLAAWVWLTGALHEDGLADTADALGGPRRRDDALRILKDSRIGVYGAVALLLATLVRWQALSLIEASRIPLALAATQIAPRAGAVCLAYLAGAATEGLGGLFARSLTAVQTTMTLLTAAVLVALADPAWGPLSAALAMIFAALLALWFRRRLGGVTGDCLGAAIQLQEAALLVFVLAAPDWLSAGEGFSTWLARFI